MISSGPIIVGASGGSGTRLIQAIIASRGVYMGNPLNASNDAVVMAAFLEANVGPVLSHTRGPNYSLSDLPSAQRSATSAALRTAIAEHLSQKPHGSELWGFKNPRSIFILPFLKELVPDFRFVHVVRDGRDMALSKNREQARRYFQTCFPGALATPDSAEAAIRMWGKVNCEALEWYEAHLPGRAVRVHYEALCVNPLDEVRSLLSALNLSTENIGSLTASVRPSTGIGRWRNLPATEREALHSCASNALEFFGYTSRPDKESFSGNQDPYPA